MVQYTRAFLCSMLWTLETDMDWSWEASKLWIFLPFNFKKNINWNIFLLSHKDFGTIHNWNIVWFQSLSIAKTPKVVLHLLCHLTLIVLKYPILRKKVHIMIISSWEKFSVTDYWKYHHLSSWKNNWALVVVVV